MNQVLEVGAFTWGRIQRLHDADPIEHWRRCDAEGLGCPQDVFIQLFHELSNDAHVADIAGRVDWGRVRWELEALSGTALQQVRVDRRAQHALDDARKRCAQFGIVDEREEVVTHWRDANSWLVPPVLVDGEVVGSRTGFELLVGTTRLGNLLGLLDRQEVSGDQKHLVLVGRRISGA